MTIVRRFLLAPSFARLVRKERGSTRVSEGYFATQSGRNSHVLVEAGQCHLVLVTPEGEGAPLEERTEVPRAHADALLDVCAGKAVYDRSRLSIGGGREALVDRITVPGPIDLVSVEFESRDEAAGFLSPPWFGAEVTADPSYDRRSIALAGLPQVGEITISNEALEALLDGLEDRFGRSRFVPTPPRRAATDTSVIDALRRLASTEPAAAPETASPGEPALPDTEDAAARPLPRRNFPFLGGGGQETADSTADARIDDVLAGLTEALGTQPPQAEETQGAEVEERPVRLRRFGT